MYLLFSPLPIHSFPLLLIDYLCSLGLVENAFNAGLGTAADLLIVWMSFIEYLVRKCKWDNEEQIAQLREAFSRATEHLIQSTILFCT